MEVEAAARVTASYEPSTTSQQSVAGGRGSEDTNILRVRKTFDAQAHGSGAEGAAALDDLVRGLEQIRRESNDYFGLLIDAEKQQAKEEGSGRPTQKRPKKKGTQG